MEIVILPKAKDHIQILHKSGNKILLKKITVLIKSIQVSPYTGLGNLSHSNMTFQDHLVEESIKNIDLFMK